MTIGSEPASCFATAIAGVASTTRIWTLSWAAGLGIVENLRPSQLDLRYRATVRVGGVRLEDMLGDVETNDSDLHRMLLLAYLHQPPQWHAGAGVQGPSIPSMPGSGTSCSTARSSTLSTRRRSSSRAGAGITMPSGRMQPSATRHRPPR